MYAAARVGSVSAACGSLQRAPSEEAVRTALVSQLPEIGELERRLQQSLVSMLPARLLKRRWHVAIDLTLIPYHGLPHADPKEVYRGEAKSGTTHFHAYATAYLVHRGRRFTLALMRVEHGTALRHVVAKLLSRVRAAGIRLKLLLLDRGFYSVEVVRYLQSARVPFLMPVPMRGRKPSHPRGPSGTYVFAAWKHSGWTTHSWVNADGRRATVSICMHRCRVKRRRKQTLVYACWGIAECSSDWVRQTYRKRFGIETSYRQMNQARIRTCTRNPALRLLFVAIALVLRNVWVWLHWMLLAQPHRGGRRLRLERLRFRTMLLWLQHLAETLLGTHDAVEAQLLV
jgi:putative transposase